jgi:hypothetical protein
MPAEAFGYVLIFAGVAFALTMLALLAISVAWVYRDAQEREGTGCLWSLLVFLAWPLSLVIYALLRRGVPST